MSDPPKITIDKMLEEPSEFHQRLNEVIAAALHRVDVAREAEARAHVQLAGEFFACLRVSRRRFDPRRLGDRFVQRQCEYWVARSEKAGGTGPTIPVTGGRVVYSDVGVDDLYGAK